MHVLQIAPVGPPHRSGMAVSAGEIARATAAAGAEVTFVSALGGGAIQGVNVPNARSFRVPGAGFLAFTPSLGTLIRAADIVHLHYPCFGNAWMVDLLLGKKPLVVSYHMDVVGRGLRSPVFGFHQTHLAPRFLRRAEQIVVSSRDYAEHSLLARYPDLMAKVVEIPFGIDTVRFSPSLRGAEATKQSRILFVGGLDEQHYFKGLDILLESLVLVPDVELTVVGKGGLLGWYTDRARDLGLGGRVTFAGSVSDDELPDRYRTADLFVLPSVDRSEAYGLVLTEAAATGIPAIATTLPGVRTVVRDGETGLLVPPNDAQALAEAIQKILSNGELRKKMGAAARAFAVSRTWEKCGEEYLKIYRLNAPKPPLS